jgi:hypothetical protein
MAAVVDWDADAFPGPWDPDEGSDWAGCRMCGSDCLCCCDCSEQYVLTATDSGPVVYPHVGIDAACGCWDCDDVWSSISGRAPVWCDPCGGECRL